MPDRLDGVQAGHAVVAIVDRAFGDVEFQPILRLRDAQINGDDRDVCGMLLRTAQTG